MAFSLNDVECSKQVKKLFLSLSVALLGLLMAPPGGSFAETINADSAPQVAMHFGRPHHGKHHEMHHGMGRGGSGICPQVRAIVQAPEKFQALKNPLKDNRDNYLAGESLYLYQAEPTVCKVCHGDSGNGMGMMAQGLPALPRNFTCKETMKDITDGQMFYIIRNGSGGSGMPAFKLLGDKEIWQLIIYIRTFTRRAR